MTKKCERNVKVLLILYFLNQIIIEQEKLDVYV
jgi:hypothetical protein